ncbi:DnaJ subfamily B member 2 [Cocos nucifera]|uniref:DnaJ subfamily B member 2 n=1 Tax=Cocos nucifera TaxID=13894 RepID=A0A8K0NC16_COCNU|nr:DnaJ subfamily B member 2 [Cocos nucifera]
MSPTDKKNAHDHNPWQERESRAWGILLFGLIGATVTTFAVGQLRRTVGWVYTQLSKSQSSSSWRDATNGSNHGGFREEVWKRYNRRMQEEYEEEMERVERIRRMQSVFNRERNKYKRSYESWRENDPGSYQHIPRDDWYRQTDTSYRDQGTNYRSAPRASGSYSMSHHYSVLGLERSRAKPYSDAEIKTAFRAKAMEYHPDQNQDSKEAAEEKFKEVMRSYEAIKQERKNGIY